MIDLKDVWDGEVGPTYRFTLKDDGAVVDSSTVAVEMYVYDEEGTFLARRVGLPQTPRSAGKIDLTLLGFETDFYGVGETIVVRPKVYMAVKEDGTAAPNLLLNPSFDTDGNADGIADSWVLNGADTADWQVRSDMQWPPVVYGSHQYVKHATTAEPDYLTQAVVQAFSTGERLSAGVWHRTHPPTGAGDLNNHAMKLHFDALADTVFQFQIGSRDWYFHTGHIHATAARAAFTMTLDGRGTTQTNIYDDAFAFLGRWHIVSPEPRRIRVKPLMRPTNRLYTVAGMDYDHNGDGIPDGFVLPSAGTNTYSLERGIAALGRASLKVDLAAATGKTIQTIHRGRFLAGQTWRAKVLVKTNGSLGGAPAPGDFAIRLVTEQFSQDGGALAETSPWADFGTLNIAFTEKTADLTLTADCSALRWEISLNTVTGTAWFDEAVIERVS